MVTSKGVTYTLVRFKEVNSTDFETCTEFIDVVE